MTPQELKNSILQLAIQGKLVEQRPEEGTAQELYAQIQAEKQRLIKEGKIKKEKPLPEIAEDEKPFDIPDSWMWVHLSYIADSSLGKTLDKAKNTGDYKPYLCSINVYWNGISLEKLKEARFEKAELEKYSLKRGDLMICEGGDVGRCAIWEEDIPMYYQNALHRVRFYHEINPYFYKYLIECYKGIGIINQYSKGVTIKHLVQNSLNAMWLPLPPLAEQHRIVAKIEELLPLVDRYEQAWTKLEDFNRRFPEDLKKSILQQAIQGKLVEQRPEEGTAQELYEQIQAEKRRLIKEGKIKKEKPLPEITEEEKPFDLPEGWMWCRLKSIVLLNPKNNLDDNLETAFIPMALLDDGYRSGYTYETRLWGEIKKGFTHFAVGDIGIAKITPCFQNRKSAVFTELKNGYGAGTTELSIVRVIDNTLSREFLLWFFKTVYFIENGVKSFTGTAGQQRIHKDYLAHCVFPLPPLAEQKRIVARLEELLAMCERLK